MIILLYAAYKSYLKLNSSIGSLTREQYTIPPLVRFAKFYFS